MHKRTPAFSKSPTSEGPNDMHLQIELGSSSIESFNDSSIISVNNLKEQ